MSHIRQAAAAAEVAAADAGRSPILVKSDEK